MQDQYSIKDKGVQASPEVSQALSLQLITFVQPLLVMLGAVLDSRLVRTFVATVHVIVQCASSEQWLPLE